MQKCWRWIIHPPRVLESQGLSYNQIKFTMSVQNLSIIVTNLSFYWEQKPHLLMFIKGIIWWNAFLWAGSWNFSNVFHSDDDLTVNIAVTSNSGQQADKIRLTGSWMSSRTKPETTIPLWWDEEAERPNNRRSLKERWGTGELTYNLQQVRLTI